MQSQVMPVILAGGSGTRLWPLSRDLFPKQFLPLISEHSMLQDTLLRLEGLADMQDIVLTCNEENRFTLAEQLRVMGIEKSTIILEPCKRNTAPAIAIAALHAQHTGFKGPLLVLPADHHIQRSDILLETLKEAIGLAEEGYLVTFGVVPQEPATGYGYIKRGSELHQGASTNYAIDAFVEKPDYETAKSYVSSGEYYWNSGMFIFTADAYLKELAASNPTIVECCREAYDRGYRDLDFFRLEKDHFCDCPSDSIDYAVMQNTTMGAIIPLDCGWNDIGSWDALWAVQNKDENDNVVIGDVLTSDVKRSYLHSSSRLLAVTGVEDHVVIETSDAVLVAPKTAVQDVKKLVQTLKDQQRTEAINHTVVYRPWGSYETVSIEDRFQVKLIIVNPGAKLSLQKHFHRAEHWVVVAGTAQVTRGKEQIVLTEDQSTYISLGDIHRLENPGKIPLKLIEVQSGSYLGEDDIVRFEDAYGREKGKTNR